jgi:5'-3' exonuclease
MILVDYSQTAISTLMAELRGRTDAEISTPLIRHMIVNALRSYKVKYGKEYGNIVLACDNKKYWRKQIFPYYKANRKKARDDSGFDWHAIFEALNQIKSEIAEFFPYPVIEADTAEADDVIATLTMWSQDNDLIQEGLDFTPQPVLILSGDHDFTQLQRYANVKQYSPIHKKWVKAEQSLDAVLMEHILTGDKGDGVPNFLSPDDVFVSGGRQKPIRKKDLEEWKKLPISHWDNTPHADNIKRNAQMVDLRNIPADIQESIINSFVNQKDSRDKTQLLNYFIAHKMKNMMEFITEF